MFVLNFLYDTNYQWTNKHSVINLNKVKVYVQTVGKIIFSIKNFQGIIMKRSGILTMKF